ncbi:MAG: YfiR family protein [Terracidiphilus sp.]
MLVSGAWQLARAQAAADEYKIKAAFLFHFAQLVEWPADSLSSRDPSLNLCIFDDEPQLAEVQNTVEGKPVGARVLHLRPLSPAQELQGCNILFLSRDQAQRQAAILRRLRGQPVLTVGESANFLSEGGMIRFHLEADKIRFDINLGAADAARLKISSRLLLLASAVIRSNGTNRGR